MKPFKATHRISERQRRIPVRVVDGVCYTRAEWETCSTADWEVHELDLSMFDARPVSRVTFMGVNIPHAKIRPIHADHS